ncbi:MAG: thioredoxin [Myxococcota bacterium]|nr:thioredoxin [Myxococcota bacterium]
MDEQTYVFNAGDADFQERVLIRSQEVPVLLDCWATWCGPCKTIGPILESLAKEYEGRFELVKVDIDKAPQVAMALRIQSVPTVYLFKGGRPVDGFQGAQPESAIRALVERHVEAPEVPPIELARRALERGDTDAAAGNFRTVLEDDADNGEALIGMARLALGHGDEGAAVGWLDKITEANPMYSNAEKLRGVLNFSIDAGDLKTLLTAIEHDPKDVDAWYKLGATYAVAGEMSDALNSFLEVVKQDRSFRDDGGRKAMLSLFEAVGMDDPLVITHRKRLAAYLF